MATDLDNLAAERKRQLLAALLKKGLSQPKDRRVSTGQERLHRLAALYPDVPLYNVAVAYRITGRLDVEATEQAVRRIAARHDILRTTFPVVDAKPVQRIAPVQTDLPLVVHYDLSDAPDAERPGRLARALASEVTRAMDLVAAPPWRVALLRLAEQEHVLVLTMHHLVTDGWSIAVFLKELGGLYRAVGAAAGGAFGAPSLQYADWAERQRAFFAEGALEAQRRYWARQLEGPIGALRLPTDRRGSGGADRAAASVPFALSKEHSRALAALGQRGSATLFMVMLAGFAAVLHRSTDQDDLLLCTPVTGRHRFHAKELIGYFNNILPMRLDLSGDLSLLELIQRTRRVAIDAYNNQDVPLQWIADLPAMRPLTLSRLLFSFDMEWPPPLDLPGVACEPMPVETGAADFDLSISLWSKQDRIFGSFRFKRGVFDDDAVAALAQEYRTVLAILAGRPDTKLSALPKGGSLPDRGRLAAPVADGDAQALAWADRPRSALEQRLVREWEDELEQRPIGIRDHLQSLGASSLAVTALAVRIQAVFETDLSITEIFQAGTVERVAALLQSGDNSLTRSPIAPIQPAGTRPPLFLCEGVGIYYPLIAYLGDDQPVYGVVTEVVADYPSVEDLASHYLKFVRQTQAHGPYYLGGVSFGGLVAFEMAQQLHVMGEKVALIALMDTPGPGAYRLKTPLRRAFGHAGNVWRYGYPYLHAKIEKQLKKLKRKPSGRDNANTGSKSRLISDAEQLRGIFKQRAAGYQVKPYAGRVTLFAIEQRGGTSDSLFDPALGTISPSLGWDKVAEHGVERYALSGGHLAILKEPFVRTLGELLRQCLERAQSANAERR